MLLRSTEIQPLVPGICSLRNTPLQCPRSTPGLLFYLDESFVIPQSRPPQSGVTFLGRSAKRLGRRLLVRTSMVKARGRFSAGVLYVAFKRGRGTDYFPMLHIESGFTFSLEPDTPPPAPASRQSGVTFLLYEMKQCRQSGPSPGLLFFGRPLPPCGRKGHWGIREGLCHRTNSQIDPRKLRQRFGAFRCRWYKNRPGTLSTLQRH